MLTSKPAPQRKKSDEQSDGAHDQRAQSIGSWKAAAYATPTAQWGHRGEANRSATRQRRRKTQSSPRSEAAPALALSSPVRIDMVVVLPAPFVPAKARTSGNLHHAQNSRLPSSLPGHNHPGSEQQALQKQSARDVLMGQQLQSWQGCSRYSPRNPKHCPAGMPRHRSCTATCADEERKHELILLPCSGSVTKQTGCTRSACNRATDNGTTKTPNGNSKCDERGAGKQEKQGTAVYYVNRARTTCTRTNDKQQVQPGLTVGAVTLPRGA